jgi:hypothetical protein
MTDEPRAPEAGTPDPGAGRDQRLASLLEVPALDEATRRRLVRTAAERAASPAVSTSRSMGRLGAAVGVAAALLVGAVVGAVVVTRPSDPETPSAARASSTEPTTAAAEAAAPAPQSADDEVSAQDPSGAPPQELGDLGAVRGIGELRAAISAGFEQGAAAEQATADSLPCRQQQAGLLGFVVVSAIGEAQLDGLPVVVLVGPSPTGEDLVVALDPARGCEIVRRVTL